MLIEKGLMSKFEIGKKFRCLAEHLGELVDNSLEFPIGVV